MDDIVTKADIRRQQATRRVGSNSSCCVCGENDPRCIELHHIAGQHFDDQLAPVCRNCHRKVTDDQKGHPAFDPNADPTLHAIGRFLLGLADLLRLAIEKLTTFGLALIERAAPEAVEAQP